MGCCGNLRGTVNSEAGYAWLSCLNRAMGFSESAQASWTAKHHARLYELATSFKSQLEASYSALAPIEDPGFGRSRDKTAILAAVIVSVHTDIKGAFWSCAGLTESDAAAQVSAKEGDYWTALMSASAIIMEAEGSKRRHRSKDGPVALALLGIGSVASVVGIPEL